MKAIRSTLAGLMLAALAGGAWAQGNLVVDGNVWLQSSERERKSFIVGVTNMIAMEKAYAERNGTPEPPAGARFAEQTGHLTIEQISERITRWYETHPDEQKTPVMKVVWLDMVRPGLARK